MFLVIGITGRVGGSVARHLLAQGQQVRALVRDRAKARRWEEQGVQLFDGELSDAGSISKALEGVEGAFFMLPPVYAPARDFRESRPLIDAYAKALKAASLRRLVVLSSNGAEKKRALGAITPLSLLEQELADLPYPYALIRPGSFYENYVNGLQTAKNGIFPVFYANTNEKYPMTAIEDIATEAASLLAGPPWRGERIIELGSMISPDDLANAISSVLGHDVRAESVPRAQWKKTLENSGVPADATWAIEEIYDGTNSHWIGFGVDGTERLEGKTSAHDVFSTAEQVRRT